VKRQQGQLLVGALLALLLLGFFFRGVDWASLGAALRGARLLPLAGLVIATLAVYTVRAWRWGDLLLPLGRVRFQDLFSATMVGFASGLLIPRAGELVRPWLVSRRYPIPTSAGFATISLERLFDLITVLALFAAYLFVLPTPAAQVESRLTQVVTLGGAATGAVALGALVFLLALHANAERVTGTLERWLTRAPRWLAEPSSRVLRAFSFGLAVLRAPLSHLGKIALQSLALWLQIALGFHLNHAAFGIELPFHATFLLMAFLVVGVAIPTPGMVGGFHAFYMLALADVYSVPRATAAAAAVAAHALSNLPILVFGLVLLGREGLSLGRVAEVTREQGTLSESEVRS
jgi:uncharacterized protein (TIRG00374 family)